METFVSPQLMRFICVVNRRLIYARPIVTKIHPNECHVILLFLSFFIRRRESVVGSVAVDKRTKS